MKVLFLAGIGLHDHDYHAAYLFDGFVELLGYENVVDWPANPTFHLGSMEMRDRCDLDSDMCYAPRRILNMPDADLIVLAATSAVSHDVCLAATRLMGNVPIVAVDGSDQVRNRYAEYEQCAGRSLTAYFRRELPIGAKWGYPLPLMYPASRVPNPMPWTEKWENQRLFFHATNHGEAGPGMPRMAIAKEFECGILPAFRDVGLYMGQAKGTRPSPEEYHARMARALVGVSWNGYPHVEQWDNNRVWEQFAFGLCQIMERPRIQIPHMPIDGVDCFYADDPMRVAQLAMELREDRDRALVVARNGHAHYLKYHTGIARAKYVLSTIGLEN